MAKYPSQDLSSSFHNPENIQHLNQNCATCGVSPGFFSVSLISECSDPSCPADPISLDAYIPAEKIQDVMRFLDGLGVHLAVHRMPD